MLRALHLKRLSIDRFPRSLSNVTTIRINAGLSNLNRDKEEISGISSILSVYLQMRGRSIKDLGRERTRFQSFLFLFFFSFCEILKD